MRLEVAIQLLQNVFMNTSFAGSYWIYQLMFLFGSLLIITRNFKDWGALALPIITGWHYIGFHYNRIFFIIAGIIFVVDALTLKTIEAGLISIQEGIIHRAKRTREGVGNVRKFGWRQGAKEGQRYEDKQRMFKKKLDVRKEMEGIQRDLREDEFPILKEERENMDIIKRAKDRLKYEKVKKKLRKDQEAEEQTGGSYVRE